ncbi:hypothetical protein GW937_00275 [Candidatus Kaiserbacteria bacterium]|nr:hypothetical protein [Candidatus Kaiserbacteria bacterium]NCT01735.1 hypothetical protein [Candidatus Parcubacteria bacterium]
MNCYLYSDPQYLFYIPDLPDLLYYSHIPTTVIALLVGLFVFLNARHLLLNRLLLLIAVSFSLWTLLSLIAWTNNHGDILLAIWPFFGVLQAFISILCIYFIFVFLDKKDVSVKLKALFTVLLIPVLLFAPTDLSVSGFNITNCDAFEFEGLIYKLYYNLLGVLAMIWICILLIKQYRLADKKFKKQILLMGIGLELFLFMFFSTTFLFSYLAGLGILEDTRYELYGLFGMDIFMIFISILIVRFKTFNVGVVASQALVVAIIILIGSQFTFNESQISTILTSITLVLTGFIGIMLIRNVRKEVKQREEIQSLAASLASANEKLMELDKLKSEFVSIASHQLRAPLTAIRGYASMLLDGSYGKIPVHANEALTRIEESSKYMTYSVEDYLSVSRIESGNMKYSNSDFNLRDKVEQICDDLRPQAIRKGLMLLFRTNLKSQGIINADIGKTIQIIQNLLNNSIKYTPKGSVKILVRDDVVRKRIYIDIEDTGIGMNEDIKNRLFNKFERASNANSVNHRGTGLGLYVAYQMAKAMNGDITAYSEGDGKGSRFTIEFKLAL